MNSKGLVGLGKFLVGFKRYKVRIRPGTLEMSRG